MKIAIGLLPEHEDDHVDDNGDITEAGKAAGWGNYWCGNCAGEVLAHKDARFCDGCGEEVY